VSNKICVVAGKKTIRARLRSWGDIVGVENAFDGSDLLYWRSHKRNGYVSVDQEGIAWIRGWKHDQKILDALVVASALSR
jgi:hypothetical protein